MPQRNFFVSFSFLAAAIVLLLVDCVGRAGVAPPTAVFSETTAVPATPALDHAPTGPPEPSLLARAALDGVSFQYLPAMTGEVVAAHVPATADGGPFGGPTPAHTRFTFQRGPWPVDPHQEARWYWPRGATLIVYETGAFASNAEADKLARAELSSLHALLAVAPAAPREPIPVLPPVNAAQMIRAQVRYLAFNRGAGVRFVTQYNQDTRPINNQELVYIFQGLTDDGRHGVAAFFPVTHPSLASDFALDEAASQALSAALDEHLAATTTLLDYAAPGAFSPDLAQLDAILNSLAINAEPPVAAQTPTPPVTATPVVFETEVRHVAAQQEVALLAGPGADFDVLGHITAGTIVTVTGISETGRYFRVECSQAPDSGCWAPSRSDQLRPVNLPVEQIPVRSTDVAAVEALIPAIYFAGPGAAYDIVGRATVGDVITVTGASRDGVFWRAPCPTDVAAHCWLPADPAETRPLPPADWQWVRGRYATFAVPPSWSPRARPLTPGEVLEAWTPGMPEVDGDQSIGFSAVDLAALQPDDIVLVATFPLAGQPGVKWVRQGPGYVSYDYHTLGVAGAGSFGLHVTVPTADAALEALLDRIAASIAFLD